MTDHSDRILLSEHVEPTHYIIDISTNLKDDFKFKGNVTIEVNLKTKDISEIQLHSKQIEITSCKYIDSENATYNMKSMDQEDVNETVTFKFESSLPKGSGKLVIDYIGLHNTEMAGFYRSGQLDKDGNKRIMLSTQFEALDARRCFPCVDEPARKATFTCSLEIDKGLTALSNMPVTNNKDIGTTRQKISFDISPKMSTYLLAFCVGEFDFVETTTKNSVTLRVYTPVNKKHLGEFALHIGSKNLDLYDSMFGKPFPLPKMDMIAIPEFAMGAMENWGLVTYRETALLIDPDSASSQQKQRVATVVAHELAHQWFGNLVTMRWWDDLWLNEGFATWMQNYATNDVYGDWKLWEQFIVNSQASALNLDALMSSHPIQVKIKRAQEVEEVFDLISYHKGGCVVRMINAFLGEKDFKEGLKLYMERHAYGNTETIDLWNAWEKVSKKPVNKIMASWTEQMGFPVVTVVSSQVANGECTLELRQDWFLADGSVPDEKRWAIPMFVVTELGSSQLDLFTETTTTIKVPVGSKGWVKLNAEQNVPLRVNYDQTLWKALFAAVKEGSLSVIDRCSLLMDARSMVKAKRLDAALLIELLKCYQGEDTYPVWSSLAGALKSIHTVLNGNEELAAKHVDLAKSLLLPAFQKVGWEKKETDGHLDSLLRALLIGLLSTFAAKDPAIIAEARKKYSAYVKDQKTTELLSEYRTTVFRIVLANSEDDSEFDVLMSLVDKLETTVEKKDIYLALGSIKSEKLKLKTLEWTTSGVVKKQDFFYAIASVSMSGLEGANLSWQYFKDNFTKIEEMLKTASPSLMGAAITYSTLGFTSEDKADDIEAFFKAHKTKMERKVSQIVEGIRAAAQFKKILLDSNDFKNAYN